MTGRGPRVRRRRLAAAAAALCAWVAVVGLPAGSASAHPLGNFTVNRYAGLQVGTHRLAVDYVVDRAEIPTFQARDRIDSDHDGVLSAAEMSAYGRADCTAADAGLRVDAAGRPVRLAVVTSAATLRPGQAGLPTLRTTCSLDGRLPAAVSQATALTVRDASDAGRIGWHEMTAVGDGTTVTGLPRTSISARLTRYPAGMLRAPLDVRAADLRVTPGGPRLDAAATTAQPYQDQVAARGLDPLSRRFTDLVGRQRLTLGFALLAVVLAAVLGGLHAFAPGHGKTVMAAFIVDGRGGLRAVTTIGLTVTATHTLGVLLLGVIVSSYASLASERVLPALAAVSGVMLAAVGIGLLLGARRRLTPAEAGHPAGRPDHAPDHAHDHGHAHDHAQTHDHPQTHDHDHDQTHGHVQDQTHDHDHGHDHAHADRGGHPASPAAAATTHRHGLVTHTHAPRPAGVPRRRSLVAMGLAGGLVPSPSALVVLLGAVALHRAWFGVLLVLCYGLGMAATMTGIGLGLSRARGAMTSRRWRGNRLVGTLERALPVGTAGVITVVGLTVALRGVGSALSIG